MCRLAALVGLCRFGGAAWGLPRLTHLQAAFVPQMSRSNGGSLRKAYAIPSVSAPPQAAATTMRGMLRGATQVR